jgi:hypothetical protein
MNDLRTKLASLFRRCTSPDVSEDEAAVALREFRSLGVTRREIDEALGVSDKPTTVQQVTHAPPAATAPVQGFVNPAMPYGKYGPKHPKGAWLLTRIVQVDRQYLVWLLAASDPPPKPWIRKQVEMALAGVPIDVAVSDAPAPAG